jgi:hypothetical protein
LDDDSGAFAVSDEDSSLDGILSLAKFDFNRLLLEPSIVLLNENFVSFLLDRSSCRARVFLVVLFLGFFFAAAAGAGLASAAAGFAAFRVMPDHFWPSF